MNMTHICISQLFSGLRKHDVAFLITLRPPGDIGTKYDYKAPFIPQVGLTYVRGCEIEGMLDAEGKVIEEGKKFTSTAIKCKSNRQNVTPPSYLKLSLLMWTSPLLSGSTLLTRALNLVIWAEGLFTVNMLSILLIPFNILGNQLVLFT